jgi:hypothetical protein
MAYLTEYSYYQLIERIEIENLDRIDKQFFRKNIFDNEYLFYLFNQLELKRLFKEKIIISDDKAYMLAYRNVPKRKDNLNYVLEIKGNVKYHKDENCTALNKGFKNFFIPEPVVRLENENPEKHREVVSEIRQWFERNNYTVERYESGEINDKILTRDFNNTFPQKYGIDPISISQSETNQFQWYIAKKTLGKRGTQESFDYNNFIGKIAEILRAREVICDGRTMSNLSRYDFLVNRSDEEIKDSIDRSINEGYLKNVSEVFIDNYTIAKLKKFWQKHRELKSEAFNLLIEYFKWSYNYEGTTFDEVFLEDFNLKACNLCYSNVMAEQEI